MFENPMTAIGDVIATDPGILSNIDLKVPIGDTMSTGGSGTISVSGSISPLTYIYSLKLNRN